MKKHDAVVVGSGPNGLAAAIQLAERGWAVLVLEANATIGGGTRSAELTLPGFVHDVCSAIHPLAIGSPFFRKLPLNKFGLEWIQPEFPLAHPLDSGNAGLLARSIEDTAINLGRDAAPYRRIMQPLASNWESLADDLLCPMLRLPQHPFQFMRFGFRAVRSAVGAANGWFCDEPAKALFAGLAAHSFLPLESVPSASFGIVLGMLGHAVGWPLPRGGSQRIADALAAYLKSLGGEIATNAPVQSLRDVPPSRAVLFDLTPKQFLRIAGDAMPNSYRRRLERYRYGPGVFKVDYALSEPIPWKAEACSRAGTVHIGGTLEEIANAEREVAAGKHPECPFVLLAQPSRFDDSRAPAGKHILWAYTHVPNGSTFDMTERIEKQIERFAPGFRDCILARHTMTCPQLERGNANLVGGDINGGLLDFWQMICRPILSATPYRTPIRGVYLCSSSTPPGGGVHGMCGFHAAATVLKDVKERAV